MLHIMSEAGDRGVDERLVEEDLLELYHERLGGMPSDISRPKIADHLDSIACRSDGVSCGEIKCWRGQGTHFGDHDSQNDGVGSDLQLLVEANTDGCPGIIRDGLACEVEFLFAVHFSSLHEKVLFDEERCRFLLGDVGRGSKVPETSHGGMAFVDVGFGCLCPLVDVDGTFDGFNTRAVVIIAIVVHS